MSEKQEEKQQVQKGSPVNLITQVPEEDAEERAAAFLADYKKLVAKHEMAWAGRPAIRPDGGLGCEMLLTSTRKTPEEKSTELTNPDD